MSAEKTPTLSGAMPCFKIFMTAWEQIESKRPELWQWVSVGVEHAVKYYTKMDDTRAYVIAMGGFEQCFPALHVFTDRCQPLTQVYGWGGSERTGRKNS
jgi:hypothetical protein